MHVLASLLWSLALLSLVGAGLGGVIGWREAANSLGRSAVTFILLALALALPWRAILSEIVRYIAGEINYEIHGIGWLIVFGHVALAVWLVGRRFFHRYTDDRARSRARRRFDRDAGGGR